MSKPYRRRTHAPHPIYDDPSSGCTATDCCARGAYPVVAREGGHWDGSATCQAHAGRGLWADLVALDGQPS